MTRVLLHDASGMLCVGRGTGIFGGRPVWAMVCLAFRICAQAAGGDSQRLILLVQDSTHVRKNIFFERKNQIWSSCRHPFGSAGPPLAGPAANTMLSTWLWRILPCGFPDDATTTGKRVATVWSDEHEHPSCAERVRAMESLVCVCGPRRLRCLFSSGWCPLSRRRHSRPVVLSHTGRC